MGAEKVHKQYSSMTFSQIGDELHRQTLEWLREHRESDYAEAMRIVLADDEALRLAYGRGGRR